MKSYYELTLDVPGGIGPETIMDTSTHPPEVSFLHFIFSGQPGDQLVECFPCFLATEHLVKAFEKSHLTGFEIGDVKIERDEQSEELDPDLKLPHYVWLKVIGKLDQDDFAITEDYNLCVSQRALDLINETAPVDISVERREA